ncbi:hypothetical protein K491DRAFT_663130 [Lophiostoma macrostomum CBS 122681]|uniref:Uncharacterized protein n=1 Tax=Lophiostoma macrostomum CBS 122681 TaxID=1314788 RepID=A0A6A6SZ42_9PLEO|nr:hypothetical protein K491DRAFT_663130 [Lophiostoma macrostomum CBS 122681]
MKDFVRHVALGMDGQRGYDDSDSDTDEDEDRWIPPSMPERKRARRYANRNHLSHFARQSWKVDWFEYPLPGTRVIDWGLTLAILYSSARIGEYIESTARRGSGRGLRYKVRSQDLMVIAFLNEDNRPELAMQLTKDAKNMTNTPHRRPQHAFAEGRYPRPLYQNALIPYLAAFLSRRAFRDYKTLQELLAVTPTQEHRAFQIHWKEDLLEAPVILNQSTKGAKRIENAGAFGRLKKKNVALRNFVSFAAIGSSMQSRGNSTAKIMSIIWRISPSSSIL